MATSLLVRNPKARKQKIERCSRCTRATLPEFLLNGNRLLCKVCKEQFAQSHESVEITLQQFRVMERFQEGQSIEAIATCFKISLKEAVSHLRLLARHGLISLPASSEEVPRPKTRHTIRKRRSSADFRKPQKPVRKNKRGEEIRLCELDAKLLTVSKGYMDEFDFCRQISEQANIPVKEVSRRLQKLHRLGFEVPTRRSQRAKRILSILERASKALSTKEIAQDLSRSPHSVRQALHRENIPLPRRESLIQQIYRHIQTQPSRWCEVVRHFVAEGKTENSVRWMICNLKAQGLIHSTRRGGPLMPTTSTHPSEVYIVQQKKSS